MDDGDVGVGWPVGFIGDLPFQILAATTRPFAEDGFVLDLGNCTKACRDNPKQYDQGPDHQNGSWRQHLSLHESDPSFSFFATL
ncbi:MAG: hypothetical protein AAFY42_06790 [Pseudomonadota bacterium]